MTNVFPFYADKLIAEMEMWKNAADIIILFKNTWINPISLKY